MDTNLEAARRHFLRGVEHSEARRFAEARACFEASLALAPGRPSVLANLGLTLFNLRQWREAIPVLQQATAADPGNAHAWTGLGLCHEALGQWQPAVDSLARALALAPDQARVWMACGKCRLQLGQVEPALRDFDRALEVDPSFMPAWSERGSLLREIGRLDEAAACFEKALALGADPEVCAYYLAAVRGEGRPAASPRRYVETLFDGYADEFESHLVQALKYRGHETLVLPLMREAKRYRAVLDLGCGTGLCGALIHPLAEAVDGVDVSAAMLARARETSAYRDLAHADLASFLASAGRSYDLVLAADVFIYVGDLAEVFRSVRRVLEPGGCFALTVECAPEGQDVRLLPSLRYAHSESHVRRLAQSSGFAVRELFEAPLRDDQRQPVPGLYVYLE